jgi:hypothetical protein
VAVALFAGGCGEMTVNADREHERQVAGGIGLKATVRCTDESCRVSALQPLQTTDESWFIALPIVSAVNGDPSLAAIRKLDVTIMDRSGTHEARFSCSLPHRGNASNQGGPITVALVHELCIGSFSGF